MKKPASPPVLASARRGFITTRWSLVLAAGADTAPEARKALSELCGLYWSPLYAFLRRQGRSADEAQELTQGFFARLLEKNDLAVADPGRGRFRAWLLASIRHYAANERERERAKKRGGGQVRIDLDEAELQFSQEPMPGLTPERAFERRWALALLENALAALREEYARRGQELLFDKLKGALNGEEEASYSRIAAELGMTVSAVKVNAFRLRRRYRELLRGEISHTVEDPEDVDAELRFLFSALEGE
ncbi:MAG: sigma-70 family RNA polymerase sigma factor [Myxococcaceae bacterium]|nr:sigma-70 family RNA polymerase sigma factor [Myxococcaceae bacterium]